MFSPRGPSLRELTVQALSSVEHGYDLLAPKFDVTPFRTPESVLEATTTALAGAGPFHRGLDVCCGTGAGLRVLDRLCPEGITGVDFSAGMLAQARAAHPDAGYVRADARALPFAGEFDLAVTFGALGHFLPEERPAVFRGIHRALRPGGLLAFPMGTPPPPTSVAYWAYLGFDTVMRIRNAVWRPPFVMYYRVMTLPAILRDLTAAGFAVRTVPLSIPGLDRDGSLTGLDGTGSTRAHLVLATKPGPEAAGAA
ncbi:class I SAM-dependent methyltransferase [Actinoplanes sp. RD1]|uniref:class I SAM-dependent methyltransferase n=1 Tax=Actinoplanes sp. RD1 TaxID=3064538 RepID=UPI002741047B|nr:class I SAM-dependent methyltransferase [Actinoplanes sp. RD1]